MFDSNKFNFDMYDQDVIDVTDCPLSMEELEKQAENGQDFPLT